MSTSKYQCNELAHSIMGSKLVEASYYQKEKEVARLLANGADPSFVNKNRETSLALAAGKGHSNIVRQLINAGAIVNELHTGDTSPIGWAVVNRHYETAKILLEEGKADPNLVCEDSNISAPIKYALHNKKMIQLLLDHNAMVNSTAYENRVVLYYAAAIENQETLHTIMKTMIQLPSQLNAQTMNIVKHAVSGWKDKKVLDLVSEFTRKAGIHTEKRTKRQLTNTRRLSM